METASGTVGCQHGNCIQTGECIARWQGSIGTHGPARVKLRHHRVNIYDTISGICPTLNHRVGGDLTTASTHRAHFGHRTLLWQENNSLDIICARGYSLARPDAFPSPLAHPTMLLSRFRQQLSSAEWAERERVPLAAGFAILCVIARRIDPGVQPDESDVEMARAVIATLPVTTESRALAALLKLIDQEPPPRPAGPELMAYATTLEEAGAYEFAADVYQLAAELGRREQGLLLAPAALARVGRCLRLVGRHAEAVNAYKGAIAVSQEIGDPVAELLANLGLGKIDAERDDYQAARAKVNRVIALARARKVQHALGVALHDRGMIASMEGDLESALLDYVEALSVLTDRQAQTRLLADVGMLLRKLGVVDTARDVFACVRAEAAEIEARWSAAINLMAVASDLEDWAEFDRLSHALESAPLIPYRRCEFLQTLAAGLAARGDAPRSRATYAALAEAAGRSNHTEFRRMAEAALEGERDDRSAPRPADALSPRCRPAIDMIRARCAPTLVRTELNY